MNKKTTKGAEKHKKAVERAKRSAGPSWRRKKRENVRVTSGSPRSVLQGLP